MRYLFSPRYLLLILLVAMTLGSVAATAQTASNSQALTPRIIGGAPVTNGTYKWVAALAYEQESGLYQFCGGTLVTERHVVTAAHCLPNTIQASKLWVLIGRTRLDVSGGELVKASSFVVHPSYNSSTQRFDSAVITLSRSVSITPLPIIEPENDGRVAGDRAAEVLGWGVTNTSTKQTSSKLLRGRIKVIANNTCKRLYPRSFGAATMLCAGLLPLNRVDTCQGDSGGPLVIRNSSNRLTLAGITSFGDGCAQKNKPGVYARVSAVRNWIRSIIE